MTAQLMSYAADRSSRLVITRAGETLATVVIPRGCFCMVSAPSDWLPAGSGPDRFDGDVAVRAIPASEVSPGGAMRNAWERAPFSLSLTDVEVAVHLDR